MEKLEKQLKQLQTEKTKELEYSNNAITDHTRNLDFSINKVIEEMEALENKEINFIDITLWQDVNGNSYHTGKIYFNDMTEIFVPYTYGYGNQWKTTINKLLDKELDYFKINHKAVYVERKKHMIKGEN